MALEKQIELEEKDYTMALEQWQVDLQEKGYAIIPDILNSNECLTLENGYWNFWRRISGGRLLKEDSQTWKTFFDFFPMHGMLSQHYSIGHMQEIWNVRSHERVKKVFETIWGTEDLVVSFDGASTGFAPEVTGRGWHRKDWLHLDQSPHRSDFECVQAWVTAEDVGPGDATLTLFEGSHKLHAKFAEQFGLKNDKVYTSDWLKLTPEQDRWYRDQGCTQIAIECPKGSMVVWDSRTVHAGRSPVRGRLTPRNRFVAYVCMMPASNLKSLERSQKQRACLEGRLTNHWAAGRVKLFPKHPRTYGRALPIIPDYEPPHLTTEQARLAGWLNPEVCPLTIENREERQRAIEVALREMDAVKAKTSKTTKTGKKTKKSAEPPTKKQRQDDLDGLDQSLVIEGGRRRRGAAVNYAQSNPFESLDEEGEDEYEEEAKRPTKKRKSSKNQDIYEEEDSEYGDFQGESGDGDDDDYFDESDPDA